MKQVPGNVETASFRQQVRVSGNPPDVQDADRGQLSRAKAILLPLKAMVGEAMNAHSRVLNWIHLRKELLAPIS